MKTILVLLFRLLLLGVGVWQQNIGSLAALVLALMVSEVNTAFWGLGELGRTNDVKYYYIGPMVEKVAPYLSIVLTILQIFSLILIVWKFVAR